ncbi:MAG: PKD domain-containing protein, partial [Bacteroidia bacterium]|nr:PKD domain-containing protein [Bacteroidia bacterium]
MKKLFSLLILAIAGYFSANAQSANPNDPNDFQYVFIEGGIAHSVALRCNGTVATWGENGSGQLGDITTTDRPEPVTVKSFFGADSLTNIIAVAAGGNHSLALRDDSTVWAWGLNGNGQLGDNMPFINWTFPVQVHGINNVGFLTGVVAIAAGENHSLAILANGTVVAWGLNSKGQLADGSTTQRNTPVLMTGMDGGTTAYAIAGGNCHTMVLQSNGRVKSCGCDNAGQLGNDGNSSLAASTTLTYVNIDNVGSIPLENIVGIAAGHVHGLALDNTGSVWSWGGTSGSNGYELGRPGATVSQKKYAGEMDIITTAIALAAGDNTSFAILNDSTLAVCGDNDQGELGIGDFIYRDTPTINTLLPNTVRAVAAGGPHTLVLNNQDTLKTFGDNISGQLGNNTAPTDQNTPQTVTKYNMGTVIADAGADQTYCVGDSVQLGGESPGDYVTYSYQWSPTTSLTSPGTTMPDTLSDPWHQSSVSGTFTHILTKTYRNSIILGCIVTDTVVVFVPPAMTMTMSSVQTSCQSSCDGTATASVSGGASPYTYLWSPSGQTTSTATGLCTETHTVTVTDATPCTVIGTIAVTSPAPIIISMNSTASIQCACTGNATASVSGGNSPYTYSWNTSPVQTTATATGLCGNTTYTVTVTDATSCFATNTVTITQPAALSLSTTKTDVSCNGGSNGAIDLSVSGGTSAYSYLWSNGATTEDLTGLSAGTYTVTVTDANSCTATTSVIISQPAALAISMSSTEASSNCICDATATASASGGTSPYTYLWSDGQTTETATGLCPGATHTVTVTDANACTPASGTVTLTGAILSVSITNATAACTACSGDATASASGGISPYTYLWSDGQTTATATDLCEGITYTITVTDATACTADTSLTMSGIPDVSFTSSAPGCVGQGVNFYSVNNYPPGYSYLWNFGSGATPATSTLQNPTNIVYSTSGAKTVTLTITSGSCSGTKTNVITINPSPSATFTSNAPQCTGSEVSFTNTGSTGAGTTYFWDFGAGASPATSTSENPSGIIYSTAGTKIVTHTVTNNFGCATSATQTITINQTPTASFSSTAPQCTGLPVDFTNTGTVVGVTWAWNFGAGATPATSTIQSPTGIIYSTPGTKVVSLVTTNLTTLCTDSVSMTININLTPTVSFVSTAPQCQGNTVNFTNTGSTGIGFSYFWDLGQNAIPATSTTENPVGVLYSSSGTKTVTLTVNKGGCSASVIQSITINQKPTANFASTAPECTGLNVDFTNTGSTGGSWTYSWNFGSGATPATSALENPSGVVYSSSGTKLVKLVVTDGTCSDSITYTINIYQSPTVSFTSTEPECAGTGVDFINTG